jgi:hypothetical protein
VPGGGLPPTATVQQLLNDAQTHFNNATTALKAGDLAKYAQEVQAAQNDVAQAQKLSPPAGSTTSSSAANTTTVPPPSSSTTASALGPPPRRGP